MKCQTRGYILFPFIHPVDRFRAFAALSSLFSLYRKERNREKVGTEQELMAVEKRWQPVDKTGQPVEFQKLRTAGSP